MMGARTTSGERSWGYEQRVELLSTASPFRGLAPALLGELADLLRPKRYDRGEFVLAEGLPASRFHLLAEGRIKVMRGNEEGREVILRLIGPGEIFGSGYVRFRHWRVYGEEGLAGRDAAVWLYNETLSVEFAEQPLSQYEVKYEPDRRHLREIARPRLFETRYRSIQPHLWELGESEWLKVFRVSEYAPRKRRVPDDATQEPLFASGGVGSIPSIRA